MGFLSFICTCLFVLERSPTSHRATVAGFVTVTGVGISKLLLIFCVKYLKVCITCLLHFCANFTPSLVIRLVFQNNKIVQIEKTVIINNKNC